MTDAPLSPAEDEAAAQLIVGRVEALKAEIKRLRAALKPLALVAELIDDQPYKIVDTLDSATIRHSHNLTMGHARAARKALEEE